nr:uncharacterized protein LOC109754163 [Aegilops tauschii subsp. strangulata]
MDPSIEAFLDRLDNTLKAQDKVIAEIQASTAKIDELVNWRPDLEKRVADLGDAVAALQLSQPAPTKEVEGNRAPAPSYTPPTTTGAHIGAGTGAVDAPQGPTGHGVFNLPRGPPAASFQTPPPPPASGDNPNLWKTLCEQYFQMFGIVQSFWVPMAALNFSGSASVWLQSIQKRLGHYDWDSFTALLCTRFGRDRHQTLIRQFYTVRQTSSVAQYIEQFELIINHLSSYSDSIHPFYFLTRFVEGLRKDIRAVVLVQRPPDLDTACALALLQEEVADGVFGSFSRPPEPAPRAGTPLPLPPPPTRLVPAAPATDRRGTDAARADTTKIKALRDYRRARGLCFKCGERWGQDHVCPTTVQLHVVEEMLELFGVETNSDTEEDVQQVHAISRPALDGGVSPKAFQLLATMQDQGVLILVDSGSSTSFINQNLAAHLSGVQELRRPCKVKVADGGELTCSSSISGCRWSSQGLEFVTDMKVLPLGVYDAILGMDWLEKHSPMTVDWRNKHLRIPTALGTASLFGHEAQSTQCHVINNAQLQQLHCQGALLHLCLLYPISEKQETPVQDPPKLQALSEFEDVFGEPKGLPPRRACDHTIPLMLGAQPVNIRPYRHKPKHKSEIERQVQELLQSGVIQRSHSTFSSPVILVKKKDGTWRLCVDYRHLNAMTRVSKFPVPVIEELLDELHGAVWFSKLDLRAGYHQICLAEGEEFKTAFQTHSGQYKFKVLSFGLAGGSKTWKDHLAHLRQVLELLRRDQWMVKRSKCEFGQQQLSYLGHVISNQGVATDPTKIRAVQAWPTPVDAKEVRRFLGVAGYCRRFVRGFGIIARPLFNLLKKGVPFVWTDNTNQAFELLKQQLLTAPVLAMPDFSKTFTVETDACDKGIGAVLQQEGHPIAFMSKSLSPRYQGLSTYEKEYLAIVVAIDQWRPYLQHNEFVIFTD